jgi:iron complex transport system substrate-binding protein
MNKKRNNKVKYFILLLSVFLIFSVDIGIDKSKEVEFRVSSHDAYEWTWSVNEEDLKETEGACRNVTVSLVIGEENDVRELEGLEDYTLRISKKNERIISMAPSCTEILFAVGAGDRVVGVTSFCDYPLEVVDKANKGEIEVIGGYSTPSFEKIVDLEPDLIVGAYGNPADVIYRLVEFGYPVYAQNPKNIEEIFNHIKVIGAITKCDETASSLLNDLKGRLEEIEEKTELLEEEQRPRVFYNIGDFFTAGNETFANEIIETAGGENIAAYKSGYFIMNLEELVDKNPQVILCDSGHGGMSIAYDQIVSDERLKNVSAVENNRVYKIDTNIISRPGPRVVDAVEILHADYGEFFEEEEGEKKKTTVKAGEEETIELDDECLTNITIKAKEDVEFTNVSLNISTELNISQPPAMVYRYLNITADNLTGDVEWLKLNFSVNESWIAANADSSTTTISLFCYDCNNDTWTELSTSEIGKGDSKVYYTATSPSFGTFAICTSLKLKSVQSQIPTPEVTVTPSPTFMPAHTPIPTSTPTPRPSGFEVVFAVTGLLVVAYLVFVYRRER